MRDLENKKKENYFIEDLNKIKSLILLFKDNYNNQELSDDLDYLFYKVDDLLKYL